MKHTSTGHLPVSTISRELLLFRIEVYFCARGHYHVAVLPLLDAVNQHPITSWGKHKGRRLSEIISWLISITSSKHIQTMALKQGIPLKMHQIALFIPLPNDSNQEKADDPLELEILHF